MIELSGAYLYCEEKEEGPRAVFIHGFGGDTRTWDRLWASLDVDRKLLRYDLRDFGRSTAKSDAAFTHVGDLAELLDIKSISRCDLVGVSMGGGIALTFALEHPEKVRSLVLMSPQIAAWEWSDAWRERQQVIAEAAREGRIDQAKRLWWEHPLFDTIRDTPAADDFRQEIARFAGKQWIRDGHALVLPDIERLHELTVPTLLLVGERDLEEFRLMADIIEASAQCVRHIEIPAHGHLLHMEVPRLCAQHISAFWSVLPMADPQDR